MKTKIIIPVLLFFVVFNLSSQPVPQGIPHGFNYQAIARNTSGEPIISQSLPVMITIQSSSTGGTIFWQELHSSVTSNSFGLITLVVGTGTRQIASTVATFDAIDWSVLPKYIKTQVNFNGLQDMGTTQLWSVPYASLADKANGVSSGTKLSVVSENDQDTEALFEVKRQDGQTVFAVYPDAVNIYVPRSGKGVKGGFAVGGFDGTKLGPQDYFRVTPDSVRIYIDPNPSLEKATKGGFAVGGYGASKSINDMYFNLTGASAVNTVEASPQILWYPNKNAFLAGNVHIGHIDSVGNYSTALGYQSSAIGDYSQAFGYKAVAFGDYSTSIGKRSVAGAYKSTRNAFAFGNGAKATGDDSYALGSGAIASGFRSFAFGSVGLDDDGNPTSTPTTASQPYSVAIGMGAQATQKGGMALGIGALASGYYSNSFGYYSTASYYYSTAIGYKSAASGYYSAAIGASSRSTGQYSSAFGRGSYAQGISSVAVGYGATTSPAAENASAFGRSANATGTSSMAMGLSANSAGPNSLAIGNTAVANGSNSTSLGSNTTTSAAAVSSTALGYGSSTAGEYATALGYNAQANGAKSVSIGAYYNYTFIRFVYDPITRRFIMTPTTITKNNIANDDYSIALGNGNLSNKGGLTLGSNNTANKVGAVALGHSNVADSAYSFAAGANNSSRGYNAFAMGESLGAEAANSFVIGYNNVRNSGYRRDEWVPTDPLFVIGNGGSGSQSDAMVVAKNGNTTINGNLSVSGSVSSNGGTLFIDAVNNRVGINNTSPAYGLDVTGTMNVTGTGRFGGDVSLSSSSPALYFYDTDLSADDFRFEANNDALSILSQGKLSYLLFTVTSGGQVGMPYVYLSTVGGNSRDLYIDDTGKLGFLSSSLRYKKNITDADDISWLYDLRPVNFEYKDSDKGSKQYGLIAEEVLEVNSDFVSFNSEGEPETVSYSSLVTPLLKAVQDQKETIESLQSENSELKLRLEKLESAVNALIIEK